MGGARVLGSDKELSIPRLASRSVADVMKMLRSIDFYLLKTLLSCHHSSSLLRKYSSPNLVAEAILLIESFSLFPTFLPFRHCNLFFPLCSHLCSFFQLLPSPCRVSMQFLTVACLLVLLGLSAGQMTFTDQWTKKRAPALKTQHLWV